MDFICQLSSSNHININKQVNKYNISKESLHCQLYYNMDAILDNHVVPLIAQLQPAFL